MGQFKFRLATLLKIREATRDQKREQLAHAYRADDLLRGQLDQVSEEIDALREQSRKAAGRGSINVDRLLASGRYELVVKAMREQLNQQRKAIAEEIERRRQALVDADREVRVLEKLRQRQTRRHQQEENRREIKRLDEVAGQLAAREDRR